jgi:hypothetical protein
MNINSKCVCQRTSLTYLKGLTEECLLNESKLELMSVKRACEIIVAISSHVLLQRRRLR